MNTKKAHEIIRNNINSMTQMKTKMTDEKKLSNQMKTNITN